MACYIPEKALVSVRLCLVLILLGTSRVEGQESTRFKTDMRSEDSIRKELVKPPENWGHMVTILENAAVESKVSLSPEAADLIIKDFILRKSATGEVFEKITLSPAEARQVTSMLAVKTKGDRITFEEADSILAVSKVEKVAPQIPRQIAMNAELAGKRLDKQSRMLLRDDLQNRTLWMAKSHLPPEEIEKKNDSYLKSIFAATPAKVLDRRTYTKAIEMAFGKIVRLTIKSKPHGADVEINGNHVGRTTIQSKPVEAGRNYVFLFKLKGYKDDRRTFYVLPEQASQEIEGILLPVEK